MKFPFELRPINENNWIFRFAPIFFNYVQWMAVTALIIYVSQESHNLLLEIFGILCSTILFGYLAESTIYRLHYVHWNRKENTWRNIFKQILMLAVVAIPLAVATCLIYDTVITGMIKFQSCSK